MKVRFLLLLVLMSLVALAPAQAQDAPAENLTAECVQTYDEAVDYFPQEIGIEYAQGFTVEYFNNYKVVTVTQPWPGATESFQYVLVQCGTPAPEGFADAQIVEVPVQSIVTMSTTFLPALAELDLLDALVGVDSFDFIYNPDIRALIEGGELEAVTSDFVLDVEVVVALEPDVVMLNAFGGDFDNYQQLEDAGITYAVNGDWVENDPLGRAEWLKFTALFFNEEAAAETLFDGIATRYTDLTALAANADARPTVFANTPFDGTWYVPGGASYVAQLFADAGADYLWAEDESTGGVPLDFEAVFERAGDADFWVNTNFWLSRDEALAEDERFAGFRAFAEGQVYNNNARVNENFASDYYESGVLNPDLILADLIAIFHPDLLPDHEFFYYRQLD